MVCSFFGTNPTARTKPGQNEVVLRTLYLLARARVTPSPQGRVARALVLRSRNRRLEDLAEGDGVFGTIDKGQWDVVKMPPQALGRVHVCSASALFGCRLTSLSLTDYE